MDRTVSLYNKSKVCLLRNFTVRRTDNFLLAFKQTCSTCLLQSSVDERINPRCLCWFTLSICLSLKFKEGELFKTFLEKIMSLDFLALNVTLHFLGQLAIFFKSLFSIAAVSAGSTAEANNDVRICICLAEILWNLNFLNWPSLN